MQQAIDSMIQAILTVMGGRVRSAWLYGSAALDDFQLGWSDIDLLVLTDGPIAQSQAEALLFLRQTLKARDQENPYCRSFEGIIAPSDEYFAKSYTRLIYWGTSGQRITDRYQEDVFAQYELAKYGRCLYGQMDRRVFPLPGPDALDAAVQAHYDSIRRYATRTDESLYSCGWLLDIARCIYTLRHHDVIAKTRAGEWALKERLFADAAPLEKALEIRRHPLLYKDRDGVKQWLAALGPTVQQYADALEGELLLRKNG